LLGRLFFRGWRFCHAISSRRYHYIVNAGTLDENRNGTFLF
jgi:hypothetical protein